MQEEKAKRSLISEKYQRLKQAQLELSESESKLSKLAELMIILDQKVPHLTSTDRTNDSAKAKTQLDDHERTIYCYQQELETTQAIYQMKYEARSELHDKIQQEMTGLINRVNILENLKLQMVQR